VTPARAAAFRVLRATGRGRRLDRALEEERPGLPEAERGWLQELAYGTVRLRGRLDHLLEHHVRGGVERLDPPVLDLLRLGAYQLLYMGSVPPYAAVSQTVEQIRDQAGRGAGGLGNAVLRALQRDLGEGGPDALAHRFPDPEADPAGHLSTWGSHPRWLVDRWLARWEVDEVRALVEHDNRVPPLALAPLDGDVEGSVERLEAHGIEAEPTPGVPGSLLLPRGSDPRAALRICPASVIQDPAATAVAHSVRPPEGAWVADLCAAPGGKALVVAGGGAYVLAADRSVPRLDLLREAAGRARVEVGLVAADARRPPVRKAPVVLLDVPCTGTGTLARHPDARWRLEPSHVEEMSRLQEAILEGAARCVKPGGLLVYATCSLEPEENDERVAAFLETHPGFRGEAIPGSGPGVPSTSGGRSMVPWRSGFDGAFVARLRKCEEDGGG
jgi:16S rRNA (cytosine967-C5)-methyltransferase